jgi:prefoldin subunit 5
MEKTRPQLKELNEKFETIIKRIEVIPGEITNIEERGLKKKNSLDQTLRDIEEIRKERQKLLVSGGKVEPASQKIKELWESCDLIEDEIIGLKRRVEELNNEKEELLKEKDICQDEIIRTRLIPFFEDYNKGAEMAGNALKGILSIMDEYGLEFGDGNKGWGKFISPSSWIGLRAIARLFWKDETIGDDFINITKIYSERYQKVAVEVSKRIEAAKVEAAKKVNTPGPKA